MRATILFFFAAAMAWGQTPVNSSRALSSGAYENFSAGAWRPPEKTVSGLPAASSNTGKVYVVTDGASSSDCTTGGGSTRALCVSSGSAWVTLGGSAQTCFAGTVTLASSLTAAATSQEVTIISSGLTGDFMPSAAWVRETTQASFSGTLTVGMGRTGTTEWIAAFPLKVSGGQNFFYERPAPAVMGNGNTYTAIVLTFTGGSNLGNGSASNLTGGVVAWGVCGTYSGQ